MEDLTPDEWDELMSEPPGGENHGRTHEDGFWNGLDNSARLVDQNLDYLVEVPIHGTRATYNNEHCRCRACRRAERDYRRMLRSSGMVQEANQEQD